MQQLSQAIPRVVGDLLRTAPNTPGKIDFAWKSVVGPAMGRATRVRLEGGVLIVEGDSPSWIQEVNRSSGLIARRMNGLLGAGTVREIIVRA